MRRSLPSFISCTGMAKWKGLPGAGCAKISKLLLLEDHLRLVFSESRAFTVPE